jgi:pimeloyl-ACP methyl ester carboxylesterase
VQPGPIPATHPTPDEVAAPGPVALIFVGGAGDNRLNGGVRTYVDRHFRVAFPRSRFGRFEWFQAVRLLRHVEAQPPGTRIRIIGHSWGADAAARIAARIGQSGRRLDLLVTVDPVSRRVDDAFLARVKAGTARWFNVNATGGPSYHPSDTVAWVGGAWRHRPQGHADLCVDAAVPHSHFGAMLACRGPDGRTLAEIAVDES